MGWWSRIPESERQVARDYCGIAGADIAWEIMGSSFSSVAQTVMVCLQDVMRLDNEAGRMNTPGTTEGNWRWRMGGAAAFDALDADAEALRKLIDRYDRYQAPPAVPEKPAARAETAAEVEAGKGVWGWLTGLFGSG